MKALVVVAIGTSLIGLIGSASSQPYGGPGSGSGYGRDYERFGPGSGSATGGSIGSGGAVDLMKASTCAAILTFAERSDVVNSRPAGCTIRGMANMSTDGLGART
jgi:hypothetical protein